MSDYNGVTLEEIQAMPELLDTGQAARVMRCCRTHVQRLGEHQWSLGEMSRVARITGISLDDLIIRSPNAASTEDKAGAVAHD